MDDDLSTAMPSTPPPFATHQDIERVVEAIQDLGELLERLIQEIAALGDRLGPPTGSDH